jgi:hypothetical protein
VDGDNGEIINQSDALVMPSECFVTSYQCYYNAVQERYCAQWSTTSVSYIITIFMRSRWREGPNAIGVGNSSQTVKSEVAMRSPTAPHPLGEILTTITKVTMGGCVSIPRSCSP